MYCTMVHQSGYNKSNVQNVWAPKDSHIFARTDLILPCLIYGITCRIYHTVHVRQQPLISLVATMACNLRSLGRT